jgi:hypothetical protein
MESNELGIKVWRLAGDGPESPDILWREAKRNSVRRNIRRHEERAREVAQNAKCITIHTRLSFPK